MNWMLHSNNALCCVQVVLEVMKTLESGETDLDVALAELEQHMAQVELNTEAALAEIRTLRGQLHKSVDNCCDRLELKVVSISVPLVCVVEGVDDTPFMTVDDI